MDLYAESYLLYLCENNHASTFLGIMGPLTSNTEAVEEMTSDIPASQISPRTLHPDRSDKSMYPYFLRTGRNWFSLARVNRSEYLYLDRTSCLYVRLK